MKDFPRGFVCHRCSTSIVWENDWELWLDSNGNDHCPDVWHPEDCDWILYSGVEPGEPHEPHWRELV